MSDKEDLRLVKCFIVTCSECDGSMYTVIKKHLTKTALKEISLMLLGGCDIATSNVIVARSHKWCSC